MWMHWGQWGKVDGPVGDRGLDWRIACLVGILAWGLLQAAVIYAAAPGVRKGYAAYYDRGLMERVAQRRGIETAHPFASPYHGIGTRLRVCGQGRCIVGVVVDVCHPRDCKRIRQRQIVVELSHADNGRLCPYYDHPPSACTVTVRRVN